MDKQKMPYEKALEEVNEWLDFRKTPESKREETAVEALASAVSDGYLIINDDNSIDQILIHPIENEQGIAVVEELHYKNRMKWSMVKPFMKGVSSTDAFGLLNAHICGLTGKGMATCIEELDLSDLSTARTIASFFLQ